MGESFWMDYVMRVTTDQAEKAQETPTKALESLESKWKEGLISEEKYADEKKELMRRFWASLVEDTATQRSFKQQDITVQVCNSAQFADSWLRTEVVEKGETLVGVAVEWNSKWRVKGAKARSRISTIQVSTAASVLIIQMAFLRPLKPPALLKQVLADPRIRKVGTGMLSDALKLKQDWQLSVIGRVDAAALAAELDYLPQGARANTSLVAKTVLALDYEKPRQVALGNWEAESLTDLQITCGALDSWVPRAALSYLESLTGARPTVADTTPPSAALARGRQRGRGTQTQQRRSEAEERERREREREEAEKAQEGGEKTLARGEPDMELYLPLVDVRQPGSCAHWLWRGSRVSDQHIARYCNVQLEVDENEWSSCTRVRLWGQPDNVKEAAEWVRKLLAKSQIDEEYRELGLSAPAYIETPLGDDKYQATALVNTPELVSWSFFPTTLTETFTGAPVPVRGQRLKKDRERAAFFAAANAADLAADSILGKHRPSTVEGPLPGGLDPAVMWRVSGYTL